MRLRTKHEKRLSVLVDEYVYVCYDVLGELFIAIIINSHFYVAVVVVVALLVGDDTAISTGDMQGRSKNQVRGLLCKLAKSKRVFIMIRGQTREVANRCSVVFNVFYCFMMRGCALIHISKRLGDGDAHDDGHHNNNNNKNNTQWNTFIHHITTHITYVIAVWLMVLFCGTRGGFVDWVCVWIYSKIIIHLQFHSNIYKTSLFAHHN